MKQVLQRKKQERDEARKKVKETQQLTEMLMQSNDMSIQQKSLNAFVLQQDANILAEQVKEQEGVHKKLIEQMKSTQAQLDASTENVMKQKEELVQIQKEYRR